MDAGFKIDGVSYAVGVTSLKRSARVGEGTGGGTTLSGKMIRDVIGTYYDYTLVLSVDMMTLDDYDDLYDTLTDPVDSHEVEVPYGQETLTYDAAISVVDDTLELMDNTNYWGELTVTFTAIEPGRIPI